ncbi:lipopolysaccharide assembly LapA domain-containing protein [Liquorilactobacillus satsumensis]|uniref:LapA family protein n=1 Tax=Liquorilactobacillus satsumensis TaxID=259059 RepID=UPI0021C3F356|nr:lipopolysaccharide assembly protein LapA domain-containing protein [Liquorilactobacillus satsumensis]MCP9328340.1 DUF1049 domain-containing protein [Liquorilactobacillus satsumensis]
MKNQWRMILALVLALIVIIFALLNTQDVAVNFIFGKFSLPLVLLLMISLLVGALVAALFSTVTIMGLKKQLKDKETQRQEEKLTAEKEYQQKLAETQSKYQRRLNGKTAAAVKSEDNR